MLKSAKTDRLRDDLEEEKDNPNIENNQIFSNVKSPEPKKSHRKLWNSLKI